MIVLAVSEPAQAAQDSPSILTNGTVKLDVNPEANLGAPGGTPSSGEETTDVGLRLSSTDNESISPGGSQEGWGVADAGSGTTGSVGGGRGNHNLTVVDFSSTDDTATSVVEVTTKEGAPSLKVTHEYSPSSSPNLFKAIVTIENIGAEAAKSVRYRRVVDWDVEPTPFDEYVTIEGEKTSDLRYSSNEGFADQDPLSPLQNWGASGFFTDHGPEDQGALFDFVLGSLAPGEKRTLSAFYGAAADEQTALAAVAEVGAKVYSLAQPNTSDGASKGTPNTFILAFSQQSGPSAPLFKDDLVKIEEDGWAEPNVLSNDRDPETIQVTDNTQLEHGYADCYEEGYCYYSPDADFNGEDYFEYTATGDYGVRGTARVKVEVTPVNDAPYVRRDTYEVKENSELKVSAPGLLENDEDIEGDPFSVVTDGDANPRYGTLTLNQDGSFNYKPDNNFSGQDYFYYRATDGKDQSWSSRVSINVTAVNNPPTAQDDAAETDENTAAAIEVLANDTDPEGDSLTVSDSTQPSNGQVDCTQAGECTYTPEANFNGEDSFTYTASDGNGGTDQGKVAITVKAVNDTPKAQADTYTTEEDKPLTVDAPGVLGNDSDADDDQLTAEAVGQPQNGNLTLNPNGSFTYEPEANYNGEDTFTYKACDDAATLACAEPVQVKITVSSVNDAPTAKDDSATTPGDVPKNIDVLANDTDADGEALTIQEYTQGSGGMVTENPDRTLKYTPDDTFTGEDTFTYTVADGNGGTAKATVTVNVTPAVNDPPASKDDSYTTKEDNDLSISAPGALENDTDPENDPLTAVEAEGSTNGTLTLVEDGSFTYKPDKDYNGTDTFTYKATDGQDPGNTSTVTITVDAVNDQPVANPDSATTPRDNAVKISVLTNDKDADGDQLTVSNSTQPSNGQSDCTQAGECTYTPGSGFTGQDSFDYTAADGNGGANTTTVSVAVEEPPPPPETNITSGPEGLTNSDTASFAFTSDRQEVTYECKLDGAAFEKCSSPNEYTSLSQGSHTFEVRAVDSLNQTDVSPAKRTFTVDTNAPTVNAPDEQFLVPSQLGTPDIPVRITWSGSDDRSGIVRYELQHSVDGGPFATLDLPEPLARALTPDLKQGTHRFRIRAQDEAGNWSAYKTGPSFVLSAYQETSSAVSYPSGSWVRQALSTAYGGYVRHETSSGARAKFDFTGREAAWVTYKGPNRGKAEIYVDGTRVKVVDLYSAKTRARQVVFKRSWASSGSHEIVVKVLGKKNSSSKNTRVGVDAFVSIN